MAAPNLFAVVAPAAGGGYTQHYFDSRGVVRTYAMTFDGRTWTLSREQADFSPLDFKQRYVGTLDPAVQACLPISGYNAVARID